MEELMDWAHDIVQGYLPDLELNGPLDADDIACFLNDRYCDTFSEGTTQEVRDILLLVAKDYAPE
jgi:hypothetical protein